ncbi:MAG: hypothetical protein GY811_18765 [Myxococcales bacterium]|nr:hypothetical protein [Myxococcales bacterium]
MNAETLENRDVKYYEIRIGTWFEEFNLGGFKGTGATEARASLAEQLSRLEAVIDEFALLSPDKGQALAHAMKVGAVLLKLQAGERATEKELRRVLDSVVPTLNKKIGSGPPTPCIQDRREGAVGEGPSSP